MSTALYRRHRSPTFGTLIGQDHIADTLRNEVRNDNLAHAYLFAGIRGTGKTSTARILARAVNCLDPGDGEPCNRCEACREITSGAAVDVLEIDAASNRGIDEMRDLREKVRYLPASLRRKVYIIDEAHMLTTEAWNAFLKTLEEPPAHVLFILATTEPHKVPETVRSRVQRFDFRRVSRAHLAAHLATVAGLEATATEPEALDLLARAAQGSVRDALSLLDQALAGGERPLTVAAVRRGLGLADPHTVRGLLIAVVGTDAAAALRAAAAAFDAGADPRQLLRDLARLARAAGLVAVGYAEGADIDEDDVAVCRELAAMAPEFFWIDALDALGTAEVGLRQPVDARLQVELCVLRLVRLARARTVDASGGALAQRVAALEAKVLGPYQSHSPGLPSDPRPLVDPRPPTSPPRPSASPSVTPFVARDDGSRPVGRVAPPGAGPPMDADAWQIAWPLVVEAVNRRDTPLAGILRDCRPVHATADSLRVAVAYEFHRAELTRPAKHRVLTAAIVEIAGGDRRVTVESAASPVESAATEAAAADVTRAVLDAFPGSRLTSSRLRDDRRNQPVHLGEGSI